MTETGSKKHFTVISTAVLLTGMLSCWYSFTGRGLPGVESVAIPLFIDRTQEFRLSDKLQAQLISIFQEENILRIESDERADAILSGVIVRIVDSPRSVSRNELAEQSEVTIEVEIKLENRETGQVIMNERVRGVALYGAVSERDAAIDEALVVLTREISNKILSGW
ncbi:LPS assembly lipoprotein LptE [candidate division KSB1 bacterium]